MLESPFSHIQNIFSFIHKKRCSLFASLALNDLRLFAYRIPVTLQRKTRLISSLRFGRSWALFSWRSQIANQSKDIAIS
ncbi:hypothetical protein BX666DRAFT_1955156 [Dichotomocladium elegans]|nr:hypothetical protein BX666DRAFT_1955156 [Dichotomocladium elegans]